MGDIFLIRHGQASLGAEDYDCLSELGELQSALLGGWLARSGRHPTRIAVGGLRRHAQTAQTCLRAAGFGDVPILIVPGLDEFDANELVARAEGHSASAAGSRAVLARDPAEHWALQTLILSAVERWMAGAHDHEYTTSWPDFSAAVRNAWESLASTHDGETWVFTSGGPISVIVAALMDLPAERTFSLCWPLVNTSVTRIRLGRRARQLITYNGWPHLDGAAESQLLTHR